MDRLACVDLPALPLQLLLRRHPEWRERPAAVVDRDKPQGVLLWVNERGRRAGILPGQRYSAALALDKALVAAEVPLTDIHAAIDEVAERLRRFSPNVEPNLDEPGVFWLDASGLDRLFPSRQAWADAIRADLRSSQLVASTVVGFTRFGVYALARAAVKPTTQVLASAPVERAAMLRVPLDRVGIVPKARELLAQLGVRTLGQFLALPHSGIRARFGDAAERLYALGSGERTPPLQPAAAPERLVRHLDLDDAEADREILVFLVKRELEPFLPKLAGRAAGLMELVVTMKPERPSKHEPAPPPIEARIRPAEPTLDVVQILSLLRLRLEAIELGSGVVELDVEAIGAPASREQLNLFLQKPRRDFLAAARALARVRASLGDDAVVRPRLTDGHLPEARFTWEPVTRLVAAQPAPATAPRPMIRKVLERPEPLPPRPPREPDGWLLRGLGHGAVQRYSGPYMVNGGWWRGEIARDYYFAELKSGALSWVYYDKRRRRWFRQGDIL